MCLSVSSPHAGERGEPKMNYSKVQYIALQSLNYTSHLSKEEVMLKSDGEKKKRIQQLKRFSPDVNCVRVWCNTLAAKAVLNHDETTAWELKSLDQHWHSLFFGEEASFIVTTNPSAASYLEWHDDTETL